MERALWITELFPATKCALKMTEENRTMVLQS